MDQENKIVFRNALGGYHKADVNAYITKLAKEFARRQEEWDLELTKLRNARNAEIAEKEELSERCKKLAAEHEIFDIEKKKLEQELAKLSTATKENKQANDELSTELAKEKAKLSSANTILNSQHDTAIKQKKNIEALAAELTALKNKLAEKNTEIDTLKKSLAAAELQSMERYAELSKQSGILEGYAAQIRTMKDELDAKNKFLDGINKSGHEDAERTAAELRLEMDKFLSKVDDKLANLAAKSTEPEVKQEEAEKKPSELDKKIDSFFGN